MTRITAGERESIREGFARLLADECTEGDVRRAMAVPTGYDVALWRKIAEMGLPAILVPEAFGGIGGGAMEAAAIMEAAGAALLPAPLFASSMIATAFVTGSGDGAAQARLLPGMADGSRIATVAFTGDRGSWDRSGIDVSAAQRDGAWQLDGSASYVLYGIEADTLLVVANAPDGIAAFEVEPAAAGVARVAQPAFDRTQRLARITLVAVPGTPIAGGEAAFDAALALGQVALAAEQAGAARKLFDITIDYIRTRVQFGRPIGGFQAIKHMAADLLVEVESCTSAARNAASALADGRDDADAAVALAAFACSECFSRIAFDSIQMHGGIGFTWEHPAHLYLRRARATAQLLGGTPEHRERFLSILEHAA